MYKYRKSELDVISISRGEKPSYHRLCIQLAHLLCQLHYYSGLFRRLRDTIIRCMQMILQRRCVSGCNVVLIIDAVIGVVRGLSGYVGYMP